MTAQIPLTGSIGPSGPFAILGFSLPVITGNADHVLTEPEYSSTSLKVTSDGASLAIRKVVAPLALGMIFIVENLTSEGFAITFGGASGTAVTVPSGATVLVSCPDATNYVAPGGSGAAALIVANLAALAAIPASGLPQGTPAIVNSVGADWTYQPAGVLAIDGITVIAATGGGQWWRGQTRIAAAAKQQTVWNVSTGGNDEANGLTGGTAIKTLAEIARRLGTANPTGLAFATINVLTDLPTSDPWPFQIVGGGGEEAFAVVGTMTAIGPPITIGVFTARNNVTGAPNTITATGQAGAFWTPFLGALVHDVTANAWFRVVADLGAATAEISEPVTSSSFNPALVAINNGDSLTILHCADIYVPIAAGAISWTTVTFVGDQASFDVQLYNSGFMVFDRCQQASTFGWLTKAGTSCRYLFTNCDMGSVTGSFGCGNFVAGCLRGLFELVSAAVGDVILDGYVVSTVRCHVIGSIVIGRAGFYGGSWLETDTEPTEVIYQTLAYGTVEQFGTASFDFTDGTQAIVKGTTAALALLLTGGYTIDGLTTAFTWSPAAGTYVVPQVNITPANLDAKKSLQSPQTGTRMLIG